MNIFSFGFLSLLVTLSWVSGAFGQSGPTAVERQLTVAQKIAQEQPEKSRSFLLLARACFDQAEAQGEDKYLQPAEQALQKALELGGKVLEYRKLEVELLLRSGQLAKALEAAKALNRFIPDDLEVYGHLVDIHLELGNIPEAEKAAQWMLDLRPENPLGRIRAARLRERLGDLEGAIEMIGSTPGAFAWEQPLLRARSLAFLGRLLAQKGALEEARRTLQESLRTLPDYPAAVAALKALAPPAEAQKDAR